MRYSLLTLLIDGQDDAGNRSLIRLGVNLGNLAPALFSGPL